MAIPTPTIVRQSREREFPHSLFGVVIPTSWPARIPSLSRNSNTPMDSTIWSALTCQRFGRPRPVAVFSVEYEVRRNAVECN